MVAGGPISSDPANLAVIGLASIGRDWTAPDWSVRIAGNRCRGWTVRRRVRGWTIVGDPIFADASSPARIGRESLLVRDGRTFPITPIVVGSQA